MGRQSQEGAEDPLKTEKLEFDTDFDHALPKFLPFGRISVPGGGGVKGDISPLGGEFLSGVKGDISPLRPGPGLEAASETFAASSADFISMSEEIVESFSRIT